MRHPDVFECDSTGKLHCGDGPAVRWRDGRTIYTHESARDRGSGGAAAAPAGAGKEAVVAAGRTLTAAPTSRRDDAIDATYAELLAEGEVMIDVHGEWEAGLRSRAEIDGVRLVTMYRAGFNADYMPVVEIARKNGSPALEPTSYHGVELAGQMRHRKRRRLYRKLIEREWAAELAAARSRLGLGLGSKRI